MIGTTDLVSGIRMEKVRNGKAGQALEFGIRSSSSIRSFKEIKS
jgi:hypothetical protein